MYGEEQEEEDDGANEDMFELEEMLASELDINAGPEEVARRQAMLAMRHGAAADGRGGWEGAVAGPHAGGAGEQQPQASARPPVDEMANKMDSMMELAFEHLRKRIAAGDLRKLWDTLLSAFERTILNTPRSKFTQFLLFYMCMQNPGHCSHSLVHLLLVRLRDTRQPANTRAACAAYLASFLARAAFLPDALVVSTLQDLASFCVEYCNNQGGGLSTSNSAASLAAAAASRGQPSGGLPDAAPFAGLNAEATNSQTQRHQVLYAGVQAVLYVLCYHLHPLVDELQQQQPSIGQDGAYVALPGEHGPGDASGHIAGSSSKEKRELAELVVALVRGPVWQVLTHRLQPLGVCLPSVAAEFVHQAASLGIVDCRPLLTQVELATRSQRPLEMFFPFDPYLLIRSSRFLQLKNSYVRWRHGHPQAAAAGAGAEAIDSDDDEEGGRNDEAAGPPADSEDGHVEASTSSSDQEDDDESAEDEQAGRSMPSDAVLHDPTHSLHAGGSMPPRHQRSAARGMVGIVGSHRAHGRGRGGSIAMGSSFMSYASTETASQGDGGMSPYGMSPHDGGDMLVRNPLGTSPGAVPMSLGTPEMHYISQVPMRIGRR